MAVKRYIQIERSELGSWYSVRLEKLNENLMAEFDLMEVGDEIILKVVEMEEEEFNNLKEFEGY